MAAPKKTIKPTSEEETPPTVTGHVIENVFRCPCGSTTSINYQGLSDGAFTVDKSAQAGVTGWLTAHSHLV